MNYDEMQYLLHANNILLNGRVTEDRTGVGTRSLFGHQLHFKLRQATLPVITTKKIHLPSVIHELLWFISGDTNIKYLKNNKVRIWDEWADEEGNLGPVYGHQWRHWNGKTDQLQNAIDTLKTNPDSRRIIVNAWNADEVDEAALPPCHTFFQFKSYAPRQHETKRQLSCQMYQRSADWFLGVPFNIASYALLTHMVAHVTDHEPDELIMSFGDTHIYSNHVEQMRQQLERKPYKFPGVGLNQSVDNIDDFRFEDINVIDYNHHPLIKGKVAV